LQEVQGDQLPHLDDFCYITDNAYTEEELLGMESDILKLLKFELGNVTYYRLAWRRGRRQEEEE
jgi:cyclin-A